jgi:hypothetical protein
MICFYTGDDIADLVANELGLENKRKVEISSLMILNSDF